MKRAALLLVLALAGCGRSEDTGYGALQLALEGCPDTTGLVLDPYGVCGFKLKVLGGEWRGAEPAAVFSSGCLPYSGDQVRIEHFPTGTNLTIVLEMFKDPTCKPEERTVMGVRGGVSVVENDPKPGLWYVPTAAVGGFKALPVLAQSLRDAAAAMSCTTNDDCSAKKADSSYVLSPIATCNTDTGKCQLPSSLYPLNASTPRAFHTATALADGRIALIGGLSREYEKNKFLAADQTVEVFDPATMVWSETEVEGLSTQRIAFHSAVSLGGQKVGVFGGAREADVRFPAADKLAGKPYLQIKVKPDSPAVGDNLSDLVYTVDLATRKASTTSLQIPRFRTSAARVKTAAGPRVLVTGGEFKSGNGTIEGQYVDLCDMTVSPPACVASDPSADRAGSCGICLDEGSEPDCSRFFFFGGLGETRDPSKEIGEAWTDGVFQPLGWDYDNVVFPTCVRSGQFTYAIGGASKKLTAPDVLPQVLSIPSADGAILSYELEGAAAKDTLSAFRVHNTVTVLEDGSVLVVGGVDDAGKVVGVAHVISGGKLVSQKAMVTPRFGHTATLITTGALKGAVLISGGFTTDSAGDIVFAEGAEIFLP